MGAVRAHNKTKRTQCAPSNPLVLFTDRMVTNCPIWLWLYSTRNQVKCQAVRILFCQSSCSVLQWAWLLRKPGAARQSGGYPPLSGGDPSLPPVHRERGDKVNAVTYEELFQLLLVLIAFASLIFQITKKK